MRRPQRPPSESEVLIQLAVESPARLGAALAQSSICDKKGRYLHWDAMRFREAPGDLSHEEWWAVTAIARRTQRTLLPLVDKSNEQQFWYCCPPSLERDLHTFSMKLAGMVVANSQITNKNTKNHYLLSSLIEESFTSSQLEGAVTTRQIAKEMLIAERPPRDKSEQMILNNYRAMLFIREHKDETLTPAMVLELHRLVTENTLDNPECAGRLRIESDGDISVYDESSGEIIHEPPPPKELKHRLLRLCDFANNRNETEFINPVVRAVMLHFMIGYDDPFVDGNGRTARALFYWCMLNNGYWMVEYLSISQFLVKGPKKYGDAYLQSETSYGDVTYFLLHQADIINKAIVSLNNYLERKQNEVEIVEDLLKCGPYAGKFNMRQLAILKHAIRNPGASYQIKGHQNSHRISYNTAKADIAGLVELDLLRPRKFGNTVYYHAISGIQDKLQGIS